MAQKARTNKMKFTLFGHGFHISYLMRLLINHPGQFYTPANLLETAKYTTSKVSQLNE